MRPERYNELYRLYNNNLIYNIDLLPSWNLISLPLIPADSSISSIMSGCSYNRIWKFNPDQTWTTTDTGLNEFNIHNGYWIDRTGLVDCVSAIEGILPNSTTINLITGWNLVGYPSLTSREISSFINSSLYTRIWEYQPDDTWKNTDTGLENTTPGRGYWINGNEGSYDVN